MAAPPAAAIAAILGPSTAVTRRCDIYEQDATTLWKSNVGILGGQVSVNAASESERRTLEIELDNTTGELQHYPEGLWYDKIIKVYRGVEYNGTSWEAQLGEFVIDDIESQHFPHTVHIKGRDYVSKLLGAKFRQATTFTDGQAIEEVIQAIASNGGITKFIMPNRPDVTLTRDFSFERTVERWKAMREIANAYGFDIYFDGQGYLVLEEFTDPATAPIEFTFETGALGNLASYKKRTSPNRIYNVVVVTGEAGDGTLVSAVAENHEPSSPTSIENLGYEKTYFFTSAFIDTTQQAQDVADQLLQIHSLEEYDVNLESLVIPWLESNRSVEFIDPDPAPNDPTIFLLRDFNIPLTLGTMSANAKRVQVVG